MVSADRPKPKSARAKKRSVGQPRSRKEKPDGYEWGAIIEDGVIIRLSIADLPAVAEVSWAAGGMDTRFKVRDVEAFAKDLVIEFDNEDEIGITPVHKMFDAAIEEAIGCFRHRRT